MNKEATMGKAGTGGGLLAGRTALITGAGSGLGRALAAKFAAEGACIVTMARRREVQEAIVGEIRASGGEAVFIQGDVTSIADVEAAVAMAARTFGGLDIAVQVAASDGNNLPIPLDELNLECWNRESRITLKGNFNLARAAYPWLARSGRGRFIGITSAHGLGGDGSNPVYASVKGALRGFAKALAKEWGDDGITVNMFAPSSESENTAVYFKTHPEAWEVLREAIPMRRMGDPLVDIAPAVVAFAGDQFRYVTGQCLPMDGGFYTTL